eukprot:Phypoly_transcript_17304.p1 GENE.Phypoly_transcript_17304~~Phypoly_transcript_17304.p1  ORF type:complete len:221 (+),score=35.82 Phypoly_transcript_17304:99-761(+)
MVELGKCLLVAVLGILVCIAGWMNEASAANVDPPRLIFDASQYIPGTDKLQLQCVGGSAQGTEFEPEFVECVQRNIDQDTKQWECEAQLGPFVNFEDLEVFCMDSESIENFKNGDPHRCGLKYNLNYTDETTLTGSFVTVVFGLIIMVFIARRRPVHAPGSAPGPAGGVPGGMGGGGGGGSPTNPRVLRAMAYGIFGVVGLATVTFSAILFYLCTSVSLT